MEPEQYEVMFRREDRHWWYAGMRRSALALLEATLPASGPLRILDAGCGTGGTTVWLQRFGCVTGVDVAWEALGPAASRGLQRLACASIDSLPFGDGSFDLVTSFEVIYHAGVEDDLRAFRELRRVLHPGGWLLLRLPAHDWLRGEHDRLVHTRRRYSKREVDRKLRLAGFRPERLTWANSLLFPLAVLKRGVEHVRAEEAASGAEPDLRELPAPANFLLEQLLAAEGTLLKRGVSLPFGLSVLALARAI